jgi:uncharacterized protein (TIGR00369 family)
MEKKVQVEFERLLGIQVLKLEEGRALLKLPFRRRFTNPHGSLHGGAIAALADTAAANALLVRYAGRSFLTVKFTIRFLKQALGDIFAEARIIRVRKNIVTLQVKVFNREKAEVAAAAAEFFVREKR